MSTDNFEQPPDPSSEGQRRYEAWREHLRQSADLSRDLEGHKVVSDVLRAGQQGLFGHMTPEEMAATVAASAATVGTGTDAGGRPIERNGGLYDNNLGPAPARVDLRYVNQPGQRPTGASSLFRYMHGSD
jgi:hypothetical protein